MYALEEFKTCLTGMFVLLFFAAVLPANTPEIEKDTPSSMREHFKGAFFMHLAVYLILYAVYFVYLGSLECLYTFTVLAPALFAGLYVTLVLSIRKNHTNYRGSAKAFLIATIFAWFIAKMGREYDLPSFTKQVKILFLWSNHIMPYIAISVICSSAVAFKRSFIQRRHRAYKIFIIYAWLSLAIMI